MLKCICYIINIYRARARLSKNTERIEVIVLSTETRIVFELIYLAMMGAAFVYGALHLFKKGQPLYFQLYVMGCGCRFVERLIVFTTFICGFETANVSVGTFFGMFTMGMFVVSANYGTLDGIVDDKHDARNKKARWIGMAVAAFNLAAVSVICYFYAVNVSLYTSVIILIAAAPAVVSSYFCTKHLFLPMDELGLLRATRPCNIIAVIVYAVGIVNNLIASFVGSEFALYCVRIAVYALPALLVIFAVKGAKKWKTLT